MSYKTKVKISSYLSQNEACLIKTSLFIRNWVSKQLTRHIKSTLKSTLSHLIRYLRIELPQNFGTSPMPEFIEGESPNSSPSASLHTPSFDALQASNAEEHGVPQSSSSPQPRRLISPGPFSRELSLEHNGARSNGAMV